MGSGLTTITTIGNVGWGGGEISIPLPRYFFCYSQQINYLSTATLLVMLCANACFVSTLRYTISWKPEPQLSIIQTAWV